MVAALVWILFLAFEAFYIFEWKRRKQWRKPLFEWKRRKHIPVPQPRQNYEPTPQVEVTEFALERDGRVEQLRFGQSVVLSAGEQCADGVVSAFMHGDVVVDAFLPGWRRFTLLFDRTGKQLGILGIGWDNSPICHESEPWKLVGSKPPLKLDELEIGQKVWIKSGTELIGGTVHSFHTMGVVVDASVGGWGEISFLFDRTGWQRNVWTPWSDPRPLCGSSGVPWRLVLD